MSGILQNPINVNRKHICILNYLSNTQIIFNDDREAVHERVTIKVVCNDNVDNWNDVIRWPVFVTVVVF